MVQITKQMKKYFSIKMKISLERLWSESCSAWVRQETSKNGQGDII
jgi:hypothetical protein